MQLVPTSKMYSHLHKEPEHPTMLAPRGVQLHREVSRGRGIPPPAATAAAAVVVRNEEGEAEEVGKAVIAAPAVEKWTV